ncbi:hypothetical protein C9994_03610 [Marivirga lumbricoides]|uniref:Uncharacterized protein n=1 Tax=Marivirga lumbricoides TaxID=1046115 RepID=A0A2T4DTY1_9BACT|nr:hypothetical protein C9994_03610 [Marivirga lumbricoides]
MLLKWTDSLLQGNDGPNCNLRKKNYLITQMNRKTKVCGSQTFPFLLDCNPQTFGKKGLNKQALNAYHHHKAGNYRHPRNFWRATEKIIRDLFNEVSLPDFSRIIEKIALCPAITV